MKVTIIGGHGKVALQLAPRLVTAGHTVTSLIRNPQHADDVAHTGAFPRLASVEDASTAELADLFAGQDAVVWAAGAGGGDPARTRAVDRDAAMRSMDACVQAGVSRYVMVSFSGADPTYLVAQDDPFRPYADAKIAADKHLRASSLDWTILGPGPLNDDPSTGRVNPQATRDDGDHAPRGLVADIIVSALAEPVTIGRTLIIGAGDVPIQEWFATLPT